MDNTDPYPIRVLVVDDDKYLTSLIEKFFKKHHISSTAIHTFTEASDFLGSEHSAFDLLILDITLPDGSGVDLLKLFRKKDDDTPVVMLSANTEELFKTTSLNSGADDYVCKPFSANELVARINAILRRCGRAKYSADEPKSSLSKTFKFQGLSFDFENRSVAVDGDEVKLRFIEFELIKLLLANKNNIVKVENIIKEIWKDLLIDKKTVEPHVSRLRKKLGPYGRRIEAVTNVGYRFNAD